VRLLNIALRKCSRGDSLIQDAGYLILSATDVANHLSCRHLTTLNLLLARGELPAPAWENPHLRILQERGLEHERAYVQSLRDQGLTVVDLSHVHEGNAVQATRNELARGTDVIVQGRLAADRWQGRPDVMLRVPKPSRLGGWSYEVVDCKLARETKAETILQLSLYSALLGQEQGLEPEFLHVIKPGANFQPESWRVASYAAYFRVVMRSLMAAVGLFGTPDDTQPDPASHCDICRWWRRCDGQLRGQDSIAFVAGSSKLQRKELATHNIVTLEQLARVPLPIPFNPDRGSRESYLKIREQARIQLDGRTAAAPRYELLHFSAGNGLSRLPMPSVGDVFFDIEGDPYTGEGGLEYLFGIIQQDEQDRTQYTGTWALDRGREKAAYEQFVDAIKARLERFPQMHVYHFGAYEPSAIKRLMLRYASREDDVDSLLRGGTFVDLHSIVKQSLIASVEQYSLKDLERFCNFQRVTDLADASKARHALEHAIERSAADLITDQTKATVRGYNEDDCRATKALRDWLEQLRSEQIDRGVNIARPIAPDPDPSEQLAERQRRVAELFSRLTADLPLDPDELSEEQRIKWLLAHALDWHRREDKVAAWDYFRLREQTDEEMFDDRSALVGLTWQERRPPESRRSKAPIDRYQYPSQECSMKKGDKLRLRELSRGQDVFGEVLAIDPIARTIDIKKQQRHNALHPTCVFAHSRYSYDEQAESIFQLSEWIAANGLNGAGHEYRAARDLLLRNPPHLHGEQLAPRPNETLLQRACRIALALDHSILPIQGPPGAGKTYTGAHMIVELVRARKRVGVMAVSHKVIRKLLVDAAKAAEQQNVGAFACAHKHDLKDLNARPIRELNDNADALDLLNQGQINVLGGTNHMWARRDFRNSVDVLFVDEAGQMALANVLACSQAAQSVVLLGDPQQLEQPQKGSHPEGSGISALAHLLNGKPTIPESKGIFMPSTRRLHPKICRFTSEMFYEGRLHSEAGLENQRVVGRLSMQGAGIRFMAVEHARNQNRSPEEVDRIADLIRSLTAPGSEWVDKDRNRLPLRLEEILVVAPYNSQVDLLAARIPGIRVGTVDRFQGQQGAVVIYSLTSSSAEDAPRNMEFLYDPYRFNVATSRARCVCIVVGSPALLEPECHTPKQMELANVLCRYAEMSIRIQTQPAAAAVAAPQ
jgi:predicted RecB family nuclease